jgi:outer membrane protein TolC
VLLVTVTRLTTGFGHLIAACALLAGCAGYQAQPLATHAALAPDIAALDRARPGLPPISADRPLTPAEVALLAVRNSPDLRATRAQRGVSQAQVIEAGLLPDPVLSGNYGVLLAGPAFADAFAATLTADVASLITRPARRRAAQAAALQVDANVVWQEWQTISRAQTLAIDLVEQGRLLARLEETLDLLRKRGDIAAQALAQGNTTLQVVAPFAVELIALQTEYYAATLAQELRWQELDALLGLQPNVRPRLSAALRIPGIEAAEAAQLLATLPQRRPDLIALQLGYASQEATLRAAVLGQFPALTVGPNYGSDTARVQTLGPSVSVGLPLFNRNRGVIGIARATREQLREEYVARRAAADGGARAMLANLGLLQRQLDSARAGLGQARTLAADADRALRAGLLDQLSYVQLVSARLGKERQVIGLEQQVFDQRTALATLLGAGLPPVELMLPKGASLL